MARTVIPPSRGATRRRGIGAGAAGDGDSLPEKLIKYVPAETLAFFVPVAALLGEDEETLLVVALVVAAVGTVGYLWNSAQDLDAAKRPLWHFYVLAVVAFAAWALATSTAVASLVDFNAKATGFILLAAVFLIPLADSLGNRFIRR